MVKVIEFYLIYFICIVITPDNYTKTALAQLFRFPIDWGYPCRTSRNESGECKYITDCTHFINLLNTPQQTEPEVGIYIRQSICRFENTKVVICCPKQSEVKVNVKERSDAQRNLLPKAGECGSYLTDRIFGGNATKIDEFPWMALIEYTKDNGVKGRHCGGTLINDRYVVTASHCVNGRSLPASWRLTGVRLGEWNTTTDPDCEFDIRGYANCAPNYIDVGVERSIPHPLYDPHSRNQLHDIALLRLERSITYTEFVQPICLPLNNNVNSLTLEGVAMDVSGWGTTETAFASDIKLKATVLGVSNAECRRIYERKLIQIEDTQLCAGGKQGVDSCRGDSGGPLIGSDLTNSTHQYYFLAGIVSFGPTNCGTQGWPGVYTRVSQYVYWIIETIEA